MLWGEAISASVKISNPFCSWGLCPWGPQQGRCPCTPLGACAAPRSPARWGASGPQCRLLSTFLLLLQIILTTLPTISASEPKIKGFYGLVDEIPFQMLSWILQMSSDESWFSSPPKQRKESLLINSVHWYSASIQDYNSTHWKFSLLCGFTCNEHPAVPFDWKLQQFQD